jgi:hypothetical protein
MVKDFGVAAGPDGLGFNGVEPEVTGRPSLSSIGPAEALHLRLSQLDQVESPACRRDGVERIAYNMTRVLNIMGTKPLIAAMRA